MDFITVKLDLRKLPGRPKTKEQIEDIIVSYFHVGKDSVEEESVPFEIIEVKGGGTARTAVARKVPPG